MKPYWLVKNVEPIEFHVTFRIRIWKNGTKQRCSVKYFLLDVCSYKAFHSEQLECVCKYPNKIKNQLDIYDREICGYFAVERNKPQPSKKVGV